MEFDFEAALFRELIRDDIILADLALKFGRALFTRRTQGFRIHLRAEFAVAEFRCDNDLDKEAAGFHPCFAFQIPIPNGFVIFKREHR